MSMRRRDPGSGTLRERPPGSGRWELRVYLGHDAVTGKPRQATKTVTARTKSEANAALAQFLTEVRSAGTVASGNPTVSELLDDWMRHGRLVREWSPATLHNTKGRVERAIRPLLGHIRVRDLTPRDLAHFYEALRAGGDKRPPMAHSTVLRYRTDLAAALNLALEWRMIDRNPAKEARLPRRRSEPLKVPTAADTRRILAAAYAFGPRWGILVALAVATGARRGELCALRWTDIDGALIRFRRSLYRAGAERGEKGLKSGGERHVYVDEAVEAILTRWRRACEARAAEVGLRLVPDAYVVPGLPDGSRPTNPDDLSRTLRIICDELDLPHVHTHSLRHFAVTELLTGGIDARNVADIAGHANPTMTLGTYAHSTAERQRAAAGILGRIVAGALPTP